MTSKNYSFSFARLTKTWVSRHTWLLALWSVFLMFAMPILQAMSLSDLDDSYYANQSQRIEEFKRVTNMIFGTDESFIFIFCMIFGLCTALIFFSCFNSGTQSDFYYSQPVKRKKLFAVSSLSGAIVFLLPMIAFTLITVLVTFAQGFGSYLSLSAVLTGLLYNVLAFLIVYMLTIFWCVVCANTVISALCSLYSLLILPGLYGFFVVYLKGRCYDTHLFSAGEQNALYALSPGGGFLGIKDQVSGFNWWAVIVIWLAVCALLLVAALFLFDRRPAEKAGRPLAFDKFLPVVKYPLVACMTILGGIFFESITDNIAWGFFGALLFGVIVFMIINVIEKLDFKNVARNMGKMAITLALTFAYIYIFSLDPFGYNTRLPQRKNIESISQAYVSYTGSITGEQTGIQMEYHIPSSNVPITDEEVIDLFYNLASLSTRQYKSNNWDSGSPDGVYSFTLHLKTKTGSFARRYNLPANEEIVKAIAEINFSPAYLRSSDRLYSVKPENLDHSTFLKSTPYLTNNEANPETQLKFDRLSSRETAGALLYTLQTDLLSQTEETMANSVLVGWITLRSQDGKNLVTYNENDYYSMYNPGGWNYNYSDSIIKPIYSSYTHTMALLQEKASELLTPAPAPESLLIVDFGDENSESWGSRFPQLDTQLKEAYYTTVPDTYYYYGVLDAAELADLLNEFHCHLIEDPDQIAGVLSESADVATLSSNPFYRHTGRYCILSLKSDFHEAFVQSEGKWYVRQANASTGMWFFNSEESAARFLDGE